MVSPKLTLTILVLALIMSMALGNLRRWRRAKYKLTIIETNRRALKFDEYICEARRLIVPLRQVPRYGVKYENTRGKLVSIDFVELQRRQPSTTSTERPENLVQVKKDVNFNANSVLEARIHGAEKH